MSARKLLVYCAWSRGGEVGAPLGVIENRFPTLFESRRLGYPRFAELSDPLRFDQSIAGFLDHIMKGNFASFVALAADLTGQTGRADRARRRPRAPDRARRQRAARYRHPCRHQLRLAQDQSMRGRKRTAGTPPLPRATGPSRFHLPASRHRQRAGRVPGRATRVAARRVPPSRGPVDSATATLRRVRSLAARWAGGSRGEPLWPAARRRARRLARADRGRRFSRPPGPAAGRRHVQ